MLPWRYEADPYKVLVSEVMLQQTQVARVIPKYKEWLEKFPTIESLAHTSLRDVLIAWQGLGYNRRGKYLKEVAEKIVSDKRYQFMLTNSHPEFISGSKLSQMLKQVQHDELQFLQELPGIGHATASAIVAYAFNKPVVFIETNIRTVYLYFYFKKDSHISDKQITELAEKTLDYDNPRDWYYALTDYGNMLKNTEKFKNIQSKHYQKQSKFEGSRRQVRGKVLKALLIDGPLSMTKIKMMLSNDDRVIRVLNDLEGEKLIVKKKGLYRIL